MAALRHLVERVFHVVAQIVEAELVVRAIGDVAGIGRAPRHVVEPGHDHPDAHAEELVDRAHPLGVAPRQIIVHRDDVDALALERVEIDGHGGDQRLALARLHLGDLAFVQHQRADDLDIEGPHPQRPLGRLADRGESLRQQVIERLAFAQPGAELVRLGPQRLVAQALHLGLERIHRADGFLSRLDLSVVGAAENLPGDGVKSQHRAASPLADRATGGPRRRPGARAPRQQRRRHRHEISRAAACRASAHSLKVARAPRDDPA